MDSYILQEQLFHFLVSVSVGKPQGQIPLTAPKPVLEHLYLHPQPQLIQAVARCVDNLVLEMTPDPVSWGPFIIPPQILGLVLAVNNCLCPVSMEAYTSHSNEPLPNPLQEFTAALIDTHPIAVSFKTQLLYHAVLQRSFLRYPTMDREQKRLYGLLLEKSPLTQLAALAFCVPQVLAQEVKRYVPGGFPGIEPSPNLWQSHETWLDNWIKLLLREPVARWLCHTWLEMPETMFACGSLGVLLDMIRKFPQSGTREFVLSFYESYCYLFPWQVTRPVQQRDTLVPALSMAERWLLVSGEGEAVIHLNRRGNLYFLKFLPLVYLIIAEKGLPADFAHITLPFVSELQRVLAITSFSTKQQLLYTPVQFDPLIKTGQEKP